MDRTTIGLIGAGNIGATHLGVLKDLPEYEIVGICDTSEEKIRERVERFSLTCRTFADYRDLLASGPDAVVVTLPHALHCPVTIEALEAGCHVLVEKPMATTVEECNRMLAAASRTGRSLLISEQISFHPAAKAIGKRFSAGEFGEFLSGALAEQRFYFHSERPSWFLQPRLSGGGMFLNIGVHLLAMTRACLPGLAPLAVSASVKTLPEYPVEGYTTMLLRYRQGACSTARNSGISRIRSTSRDSRSYSRKRLFPGTAGPCESWTGKAGRQSSRFLTKISFIPCIPPAEGNPGPAVRSDRAGARAGRRHRSGRLRQRPRGKGSPADGAAVENRGIVSNRQ